MLIFSLVVSNWNDFAYEFSFLQDYDLDISYICIND